MNIALFDFDGTISSKDSFMLYTLYISGWIKFIIGLLILSPILIMYKFRLVSNQFMKSSIIRFYYKNLSLDKAETLSRSFNSEILTKIIRKKALDRIEWHKKNDDKIVVVTASPDLWLNDWCKKNDLDLVSTRLEVTDGKFTGNLIGMNCFGPEKVRRVKEKYELENYEKIYAYGDSRGDKELLEFADYSDFKPFA